MRSPGSFAAVIVCCALLSGGLIPLAGCGDEDGGAAPCAPCRLVAIEGRVTGGEGPVSVTVTARNAARPEGESPPLQTEVRTEADSTGWYQLLVPSGRYLLYLQHQTTRLYFSRELPGSSSIGADTIEVGEAPVRIDFECGSVRLHLDLPGDLEGRRLYFSLASPSRLSVNPFSASTSTVVSQGSVDLLFPLVPARTVVARVSLPEDTRLWLPPTYVENDAEWFIIAPGRTSSLRARITPPARLRGSVTGSWQAMGLDPPVVSVYLTPGRAIRQVQTDAAGRFDVPLYLDGSVRLRTTIHGADRWIGGARFEQATWFPVHPGVEPDSILIRESGILCRFEGGGNSTVLNLDLLLTDSHGAAVIPPFRWRGADPLPLPNLGAGDYFLNVSPDTLEGRWKPQWYDRKPALSEATPIRLSGEGEVVPITVRLETKE